MTPETTLGLERELNGIKECILCMQEPQVQTWIPRSRLGVTSLYLPPKKLFKRALRFMNDYYNVNLEISFSPSMWNLSHYTINFKVGINNNKIREY